MGNNEVKDFVLDYFKVNNAKVLESKKHFTVQVPKRIADKLNCEPVLNITFDKNYAEKNEDIDFIAIGSALLNKIIEAAGKRGLTTVKCYKGKEFFGLEMNFKVTFESIDKKEKLLSFLVDLKNKKIDNNLLNELKRKLFEECNSANLEAHDIEQCYSICLEEIKKLIAQDVEKIKEKLKNALQKEKGIIEKFYDGIIADLRKRQEEKMRIYQEKMEKVKNATYIEKMEEYRKERDQHKEKLLDLQDKQTEELTNYFELKEKRLAEIENQFKLNVKIVLSSAALVKVI